MKLHLKNGLLCALGLLTLLCPAWAQRPSLITPLSCDVDGDGVQEIVAIRPFVQDGVELGQLVLLSLEGDTLWAGPTHSATPVSPQEPDIFLGEFDLGDLEAVGDFQGDGKLMLLGTYQKSDVRPTRFRLLEWDGQGFRHVRSGSLLAAPQRPATFVWSDDPGAGSWIESFSGFGDDGLFRATLADLDGDAPANVLLSIQGQEFVLTEPAP
jgi:hypothetical protein